MRLPGLVPQLRHLLLDQRQLLRAETGSSAVRPVWCPGVVTAPAPSLWVGTFFPNLAAERGSPLPAGGEPEDGAGAAL